MSATARTRSATWGFEVWNEANLEVFWNGTQAQYHLLYETAARAVKAVDPRFRVGGPGSAAAEWVGPLLEHCRENDVPIDFVSTHTYGNAPLDFRPDAFLRAATGKPEPEILWTEWGVTPTHFHRVSDSVFSAPFVLRGMKSALGRPTPWPTGWRPTTSRSWDARRSSSTAASGC